MGSHSCHEPSMLTRALSRCALLTALVSLAACDYAVRAPAPPTSPPYVSSPPSVPSPPAAPGRPADPPPPTIAGAAVLYRRASPLSNGGEDSYLLSREADSAFTIIFPNGSKSWGWSGRYERADSVLTFHYNATSGAGELRARGIIRGDMLFLQYNLAMQLTDFEDGVYISGPIGQ